MQRKLLTLESLGSFNQIMNKKNIKLIFITFWKMERLKMFNVIINEMLERTGKVLCNHKWNARKVWKFKTSYSTNLLRNILIYNCYSKEWVMLTVTLVLGTSFGKRWWGWYSRLIFIESHCMSDTFLHGLSYLILTCQQNNKFYEENSTNFCIK